MINQKITVQLSEDPFDVTTVNAKLARGTKILATDVESIKYLNDYKFNNDSFKSAKELNNKIVEAVIYAIYDNNVLININDKYTAFCNLLKEPSHIKNNLKVGQKVDVKLSVKKNGEIYASFSDVIYEYKKEHLFNSIGDKTISFDGTVKELIHSGYWVDVSGIKCFMPGSLGGLNKLTDFNSLIGKTIKVIPITYSNDWDTVVVSHRDYLKTLIPQAVENLKQNINRKITGKVTGATNFGVFVEFNDYLTGLIPKDELVESQKSYERRTIHPDDEISFWVKNIINNNKIILTQIQISQNPWDNIDKKYPSNTKVKGSIHKINKDHLVVKIENNLFGLLYVTSVNDFIKGDSINIIIDNVDKDNKIINLKLL